MEAMEKVKSSRYTSSLASILTMIGVAVGLGNVWRFPYMMGSYGGSAFLLVYLLFTIAFAIPALMAELAIGRLGRNGIYDAFGNAFGQKAGRVIGSLLLTAVIIAGSYYAVVIANLVYTTAYSLFIGFSEEQLPHFQESLGNPWLQYGITLVLILLAFWVIDRGLKKGIERISTIVVPFFMLALIYLIIFTLTRPQALQYLRGFLQPDFTAMSSTEVFAALGQAFFSVGLGGTFIVVYGSYLKEEANLPKVALFTGLGDVGASLLVSLFLVPAILLLGLDMGAGPGLIFNTLPALFGQMPLGRMIGSIFLLAIVAVAFLSLIASYEVPVSSIAPVLQKFSRRQIIAAFVILQAVLSLPSTLYPELIGILDMVCGSGMQVFGSGLSILGLCWGIGKIGASQQFWGNDHAGTFGELLFQWLKWVIPAVLLAVLLGYIYTIVA